MKRTDIKRRPLADTTLSSLEPEAGAYRELDSPGLYFRVKPNGQKSWELRYKKPDGKWSWLGLGGYPEVGGAFARQKAADLRADASEGKNPITSKKARQAAEVDAANDTFEALAREWHMSRLSSWDAGTAKRILGALERHVFPSLGKRPYTSIMSMEWMELLRGLERQGILEQMSRVRAYCKDIYDLARVTGRAVNNPLEGVHKFLSSGKAENYAHVSPDELPGLLRAIRSYPHAKDVQLGLRLLTLMAVRPSELREAHWVEFDFDKKLWTVPVERKGRKKGREHLVPLCTQAVEALLELRQLHITEAQKEHAKIENEAAHLANTVLEEKWNEAAKALLETGGKLWAARNLINREPVALMKLDIPEQGGHFGSWTWRELATRSHQHSLLDLLAA